MSRGFTRLTFRQGKHLLLIFNGLNPIPTGEEFSEMTGPVHRSFGFKAPLMVHVSAFYVRIPSFFYLDDHVEMTTDGHIRGPTDSFEVLVGGR